MPGNLLLRRRVGQGNHLGAVRIVSAMIIGTTIIRKRGAVLRPTLYIVERWSMKIGVPGRRESRMFKQVDRAVGRDGRAWSRAVLYY